jgi:ParB family chromosome partitioning protein
MDGQSNNAAFEPAGQLNDDAITPTTQVSVDSLCPATPPIGAAVTESPEPDPHTRASGDEAGGQMSGQVREIAIANIDVPPTKRPLKEETVEQIMTSMPEFGLGGTPLTVYRGEEADKFVLIAGGHRLEAARRLGGTVIAANIVDWEPDRRRMWEIVENLHRAELTELERAEQTVELIKLRERRAQKGQIANEADKPSQVATVSKGGRGKKGGIRGAARELGISKDDAHRSLKIDGLSKPAKDVARETGLDENRRVLLEAAKAEDSVAFLREQSARRDTGAKVNANLAPNRDEECADFLLAEVEADKIPTLISLMASTKIKNVIELMRRKRQPAPPSDGGATARGQKTVAKEAGTEPKETLEPKSVKTGRSSVKPHKSKSTKTNFLHRVVVENFKAFRGDDDAAEHFRRSLNHYRCGGFEHKDGDIIVELGKAIAKLKDIDVAQKWYEGWFDDIYDEDGKPVPKDQIESLKSNKAHVYFVADYVFSTLLEEAINEVKERREIEMEMKASSR